MDLINEAARKWDERWNEMHRMRAVTSLMRAQQIVIAELDAILKPHGLTFARYEALVLLSFSKRGSLPLGKMGERLQVHPTSITSIVRKLVDDGFIERTEHPSDGRAILASITNAGRAVVEAATKDLVSSQFGLASLSEGQADEVFQLLSLIRQAAGDPL